MKFNVIVAWLFLFAVLSINICRAVEPIVPDRIDLFSLKNVRITDGPFKAIEEKDHQYLLTLEPDRLLSWFRREAGLTPKAQPYPFWESDLSMRLGPLAGHILGFYLSSMSMMYDTTGDEKILERLRYVLKEMKECQDARGDGYLLATINGRQLFDEVAKGNIKTNNPTINGVWEPVYIMNKLMLGLHNAYRRCGLEEAKPILVGMADWFGTAILDKLSHENVQKLLVCEHGSINESFIDVYNDTDDKKYLEWAKRLNDEDMWVPLSQKKDILPGWHANTQIPKFTGFADVYRYTGDRKLFDASEFFWNLVVDKHTWVNGGNSTGEHFFPENEFENRVNNIGGPESCNSVNLMRLTESLYRLDGSMKKIDYYERVLYNHILANYDPHEGMCTYYTPMRPGHYRVYATKYNSFWCCVGTGFEAPAKFAQMIYAHDCDSLFVNLFVPSTVSWNEKGIELVQQTRFPDENRTELTVHVQNETTFNLKIRKPYWVEGKSFSVNVNGTAVAAANTEDGYVSCERVWKNGDRVTIEFSPAIDVAYLKNSKKYVSIQYGPIVMAVSTADPTLPATEFRKERLTLGYYALGDWQTPVVYGTPEEIKQRLSRKEGKALTLVYRVPSESDSFELVPFNGIHFNRYTIYFRCLENSDAMDRFRKGIKDRFEAQKKLDEMTIDKVVVGNFASEKEHKMEAVNSHWAHRFDSIWRDARNGGYIMYEMKVEPGRPQLLYLVFMSNDFGQRTFDVLLDGTVLETINMAKESDGVKTTLFKRIVAIPESLVKGKERVTIKIHAKPGNTAGGVWELRTLSTENQADVPDVYQYELIFGVAPR